MKDKKHLVKIRESAKEFYIYKPDAGDDYHLRFTPPRWMRERWQREQKAKAPERITRSLETPELAPARERAKQILKSFFSTDEGRAAEETKLRHERFATLGEIVEAYRNGARSLPDKEELKETTINGNIGCLRKIADCGLRIAELDTSCLTSDVIEGFKRRELDPLRDDPMALESRKRGVNSTIRQARSIFSKEYMPLYAHLNLPDLTSFREARLCKVDRQGTRYVPIGQERIDAMEAEIRCQMAEVKGQRERAMYLAFYFMLFLGMRQGEVREARLEWIEEWPTAARMAIVRRPYFKPKGVPGQIAIAPQLLADIKELSGAKLSTDYLIPAATETERRDVLRYDLSRLVRRHLGDDRTKTCHELRKHAISMMLMRTRNYVDTLKFSRHADVRTLQEHYGSFLDELPPITSSNWRTDALVAVA